MELRVREVYGRDVSATRVLELLFGHERRSRYPLCQQVTLNWYQNSAFDAASLYCRSCDLAGDVLELARQTFGISLQGTIAHLTQEGRSDDPSRQTASGDSMRTTLTIRAG